MNDSRIQMDSARILQGEVAAVVSTHAHQHSTAQELGGGALWKNHPELQRGDALGERTKTLDARYELDVFRLATWPEEQPELRAARLCRKLTHLHAMWTREVLARQFQCGVYSRLVPHDGQ